MWKSEFTKPTFSIILSTS